MTDVRDMSAAQFAAAVDLAKERMSGRAEGYYWVQTTGGKAVHIAEWTQTDGGQWKWALTGASIGFPDQSMTVLSGPLRAPKP